ncbi:PKD domain-containing protein [Mangrovivirga sp. M17]|uniref:PKD domain-containing protein n=1 Tax=Mangrovivirga halotolerans TaxID=2993936 RepID=A0ABT3RRF4_9BACT|nr:PKD domain-containing protein [Mangrovivirga halotolerans]
MSGNLSADASAICAGESVDLSFTLSGSSTTYDVTYTDGTTPVTLTGISNGHVETITPSAAAIYSLTSITANASGCTTTSNLSGTPTVTVNPLPDGSLSGGATVCAGGSTNLTFNFAAGTAPFDVVYTDGTTNFTANNITDGATVSVSPSTTTTYTLVSVTDDNGCSDPTPTGSATVTVSPQVSGNLSADASAICAGESVDLSFTLSGSSTTYDVTYTDGTTPVTLTGISNGHIETITPSATATYSITSITANSSSCSTTSNVSGTPTVTVNPLPDGSLSGGATVCAGGSTNLTFNFAAGTAPFDVVYTDGTTNFTANNITDGTTVSVSPSTTTTYTLVSVTDDNGCSDPTPTGSATVTVSPQVSGNLSADASAICAGESVDLSFTLSGSSTTYDVTYTDGTTPVTLTGISNGHIETITPSATATYSITSITANSSSCSTTSNVSGTPTVTVNPLPDGSLSGGATVCAGGSTNLTFNFAAGTAPFDVVYTDGTTNFTANNITDGATVSVSPSTTTTYTLVSVTDDNGCSDPTPTGSATVTVSPQVSGNLSADASAICAGESVNLSFTLAGSSTTYDVTYTEGTTPVTLTGISNGHVETITPTATATYSITSITANSSSCSTTSNVSGTPTVTVNPLPNVIATPVNETICSGEQTNISFSTDNGVSPVSYSWIVSSSGADISGATSGFGNSLNQILFNSGSSPQTVTYTVSPESEEGCTGNSIEVTITVNPTPELIVTNNTPDICRGETTDIQLSGTTTGATISLAAVNYNGLTGGSYGTGGTFTYGDAVTETLTNGGLTPVTIDYVFTVSGNGCTGITITESVTVNPTPDLTVTNNTPDICSGESVKINVLSGVTGATITLQSVNYNGLTGSYTGGETFTSPSNLIENLSNTTTAPVTVEYSFAVSANGCDNPAIQTASVIVNPIPDLAVTNNTPDICNGETTDIQLSGTTTGTTISLAAVNYNGLTGGSYGTGGTFTYGDAVTETLTNGGLTPITIDYVFTVSGNGCTGTTITESVTVNPTPDLTVTNNTPDICGGESVKINVLSGVAGATITLQSVNYNGLTGSYTGGETFTSPSNLIENLSNTTTAPVTVEYSFAVSANGCDNPAIQTASVIVNPIPDLAVTNNTPDICSGETTDIQLSGTTTGATISLAAVNYNGLTGGSYGTGGTFTYGDAVTETLTNGGLTPVTIDYVFTVSGNGCTGTTITESVTVNPTPDLTVTNNTPDICSGESVKINVLSGVTGATITLQSVNYNGLTGSYTGGETFTSASGVVESLNNNTTNPVTVEYIFSVSANGCNNTSTETTTVTVSPLPTITNSISELSDEICSNDQLNFNPVSSVAGTTFNWTSSINGTIDPASISVSGSGVISDSPVNTGAVQGSVVYTITPIVNGCAGPPREYVVVVNPEVNVTSASQSYEICGNETTNIQLIETRSISGVVFNWTVTSDANISGATDGSGTVISQLLQNNSNVSGDVVYTIIPSYNGCQGMPYDITVTVKPIPTVGALPSAESICNGTSTNITLSNPNNVAGTTYSWTSTAEANITGATDGTGNVIQQTLFNSGNNAAGVQYEITPISNGCAGTPITAFVTVNPELIADAGNDQVLCEGTGVTLGGSPTASGGSGSYNYNWTGPDNFSSAVANPNNVIAQVGVNTYTVVVTDSRGCQSAPQSVNITVNDAPEVFAGNDSQICRDQVFNLQGSIGGSATEAYWSSPSGTGGFSPSNLFSEALTYTPTQAEIDAGQVILTLTTNDPAGPCGAVIDQVLVIINDLPNASFSGLPSELAENDPPVELTPFNTGGNFLFNGVDFGTNIFDPNPNTGTNATLGLNDITYTFTDGKGCTNSTTQTVFINALTPINFFVGDSTVDASGNPVVCSNEGLQLLVGSPLADQINYDANTPPNTVGFFDGANVIEINGEFFFDPTAAGTGIHQVTYTYTNENNATNQLTKDVFVFGTPQVDFSVSDQCVSDPVLFQDASSIEPSPFSEGLVSWTWEFGDESMNDNRQDPDHLYNSAGTYDVTLTTTTSRGCTSTGTKSIKVGEVPVIDFLVSRVCNGDQSIFTPSVSLPDQEIVRWLWEFGDGTQSVNKNATYTYPSADKYNTSLTVETTEGCINTASQEIFILPRVTLVNDPADPYLATFNIDTEGWVAQGENVSWEVGIPSAGTITPIDNEAWVTNASGSPSVSEDSWVNCPCFDFSNMTRPMLSLDYFSDLFSEDGAVIQYSLNGGETWEVLGQTGSGINWYTSDKVTSRPGDQDGFNSYGWNTSEVDWKTGRIYLDELIGQPSVRMRVAFATGPNPPLGSDFDGFALDNFKIFERSRNVLVEQFSNLAPEVLTGTQESINRLDQVGDEILMMHYFTDIPTADSLYDANKADQGARGLYYSVSQTPTTVIDGNVYNGLSSDWQLNTVLTRSLIDPDFKIDIDFPVPDERYILTFDIDITSIYDRAAEDIYVQTVVVENEVLLSNGDVIPNLVKEFLPSAAGTLYRFNWAQGERRSLRFDWEIAAYDPSELAVIVFIQTSSGEVLQSKILKAPDFGYENSILTGIEDDFENTRVLVYPNPAVDETTLLLEEPVKKDTDLILYDSKGSIVYEGKIMKGAKEKQIELSNFSTGIYNLQLVSEGRVLGTLRVIKN